MPDNEVISPQLWDFLPQGAVIEGLLRTLQEGTWVHAYLITGAEGVGKRTLAREMARYLLCTGENRPCGVCEACQQVLNDSHPDMLRVRPGYRVASDLETDRGKHDIIVDTIRELISRVSEHAYEGQVRISIIEQSDRLNQAAQNALLKTLEEPPDNVIFLLLTDTPSALLPTIVSRCRHIALHPWDDAKVEQVVKAYGYSGMKTVQAVHVAAGSIGKALRMAGDDSYWEKRSQIMEQFLNLPDRSSIYGVANNWKDAKDTADELLDILEDMVRIMLLCHNGQGSMDLMSDFPEPWKRMVKEGDNTGIVHLLMGIQTARAKRMSQVTWTAVLERLLLDVMEEKAKWSV